MHCEMRCLMFYLLTYLLTSVYLDFTEAFDFVVHTRLLAKFNQQPMNGLSWCSAGILLYRPKQDHLQTQ